MAGRKLSQQQQRRIRAARSKRVTLADTELGEIRRGTVIVRYGKRALVEDDGGQQRQCVLRANIDSLVAGDEVAWRESDDGMGVVDARKPRRSELCRPDSRGKLRPVAANIDLMLIVVAPKPPAHAGLIDRYLVAAEAEGMEAVLVLNKADLLEPQDPLLALVEQYQALGYTIAITDREQDPDARRLGDLIGPQTLVLVGQSGVGKSSLIQRLLPEASIRVGELSDAIDKGKHTTTAAELYHLPGGGRLVDSPGIREFHLHHLPEAQIAAGFREFAPFLGRCKFRDCSHDHEAGCALLTAVNDGLISEARFASYRAIVSQPAL